ncbi:MAG: MarR family transcriptional regulator [Candidatus Bathyarchaeota archaeon]|nr:MAG: MarR family transcriptional regulator [Candidatus Bathyarchaeota archaeon]
MRTKTLLAMFGMIASTFALFIKMMTPSSVQFVIEGNVVELNQVPSIYSTLDVLLIGVSCFVLGASLINLLQADGTNGEKTTTELGNWDQLIEGLTAEDERRIVQIVANEGGTIFQSQLVEMSGFSKSKVSLVLDRLEARGILERRRHGMSNAVVLK